MSYVAPVDDILHALKTAAGLEGLIADGIVTTDMDTVTAVITEAGKFGAEVLDPLNWSGDQEGSKLINGVVHTPKGWKEAYKAFADGGWSSLPCAEEHGGQGLPQLVAMVAAEIWNSTNMGFGL
jgi:alkylation response protein AidB-like acyl-CoA dehydrogenase